MRIGSGFKVCGVLKRGILPRISANKNIEWCLTLVFEVKEVNCSGLAIKNFSLAFGCGIKRSLIFEARKICCEIL
jgi:hypothetical protein